MHSCTFYVGLAQAHPNNTAVQLASSPVLSNLTLAPALYSYPLFCMQLLKHLANAMQRAEGFVLERALVLFSLTHVSMHQAILA